MKELAARASDQPAAPLAGNRHFWRSDMMVHHRAGYYASARMFSRRLANTDIPCNDEGLKSHHIADGCNLVMRTGREYRDIYPVWNWQQIPGTTVEQTPDLAGSPRRQGQQGFAGGVSDGTYGLAAFDMCRDVLHARKSWFFFDRQFVCLGAGITCPTQYPIVTTLNQCRLEGTVHVSDGASAQQLGQGDHTLDTPAWIWHDRIAYCPLQPTRLRLHSGSQQGSWWDINHQYAKDTVSLDVFRLGIDHGATPQDATYAYVVAPDVDLQAVGDVLAEDIEVVRNEPQLQAVWHGGLKIAAAAFYTAGELTVHDRLTVAVDMPCLLLARELAGELAISLSNPENQAATVRVQLSAAGGGGASEPRTAGAQCHIAVDLPVAMQAGASVTQRVPWP